MLMFVFEMAGDERLISLRLCTCGWPPVKYVHRIDEIMNPPPVQIHYDGVVCLVYWLDFICQIVFI